MKNWPNDIFNQHILPGRYARKVEKEIIIPNYNQIVSIETFDLPQQNIDEAIDELKAEVKEQYDRKKSLEDKIKSILFVITVSTTAITFCLKDFNNTSEGALNLWALALLGLSIFYFVSSAILSIQSLMPIAFHQPHPAIVVEQANQTISWLKKDKGDELRELIKSKLLNDNLNLRTQNATYAVLRLLRNGILLFAFFFVAALIQKSYFSNKHYITKRVIIKKHIAKTNKYVGFASQQKILTHIQSDTLNRTKANAPKLSINPRR